MTQILSDENLLLYLKFSDPDSRQYFETFYLRYIAKVKRYLNTKKLNPEQVEDLCQQVFIKIFEKRTHYRPGTPAPAWVFIITRSLWLDWTRQQKRQIHLLTEFSLFIQSQNQLTSSYPEQMISTTDLSLQEIDLKLLQSRFEQGLSYQELAVKFDQSATSLRKRISRLYQQIRNKKHKEQKI